MTERQFLLPDVGEGLVEADIVTWKVGVGDTVTLNQPLVDVETAKALVELPSPFAGVVSAILVPAGETAAVGTPLIVIGDGAVEVTASRDPVLIGYGVAPDEPVTTRRRRRSDMPLTPTAPRASVRTTPPVRLLARQLEVALEEVTPTGRNGLVTRADVERFAQNRRPTPTPRTSGFPERRVSARGVIKTMADAMVASVHEAPQAAAWVRVDVSATMDQLAQAKRDVRFADVRLSPLTYIAMGLCDAVRHYPAINSFYDTATNEIVTVDVVNLGIAANTPRGLMVPSVKGAEQLDFIAMAQALTTLVNDARAGTSTPADLTGATITITNVGPFGIDGAVALLPLGTAAILCVGQIVPSPWVVDNEVVVRPVVEISLTFDHRHVDGALASAVLAHVAAYLRQPPSL